MWTIFKVFIAFATVLPLFCLLVLSFGPEAHGILAPKPGIKPPFPALEGEVLATGPSGNPYTPLFTWPYDVLGLPRWLSGKDSACSAGDMGLIPGPGRSS